jgi:hypothetical protein
MRFKKRTEGPEALLVDDFLAAYNKNNSLIDETTTIFSEPFIGSGFPDLVIVLWEECKVEKWHPERKNLCNIDLKILHHMVTNRKNYSLQILREQLGYSNTQLKKSLGKLTNACLITHSKDDSFRVCSKNDAFFIKSIIAIEAKIKNWKNAFLQAETNLWFASESYVLLPAEIISNNVIEKAVSSPVGLLSFNDNSYNVISKSEKRKMPVSYCSWIFNENICKNSYIRNGNSDGASQFC